MSSAMPSKGVPPKRMPRVHPAPAPGVRPGSYDDERRHVCRVPEDGKPSELWMCPVCMNWWFALSDDEGRVTDWAKAYRR